MNHDLNRKLCLAPMMGYTDRHFRYLLRLISPQILLYTEMYTASEILKHVHRLQYDAKEHPLAIQLGGSNPAQLAQCAKIVTDLGFDEINLNVGCPSNRVQNAKMGACLMKEPQLVAECFTQMQAAVDIPVTVKCRLGVDEQESYDELCEFVQTVQTAGCLIFIIHARKAWLQGLNPKQNRSVPPLKYEWVYQLKRDFPQLTFVLNGGVCTIEDYLNQLQAVDGVMLGRALYQNPFLAADIESKLKPDYCVPTRTEILEQFLPYLNQQLKLGIKFTAVGRHLLSLFYGKPGAKEWRKTLVANSQASESNYIIQTALAAMYAKTVM